MKPPPLPLSGLLVEETPRRAELSLGAAAFLTQGSNPGLSDCWQILSLPSEPPGKPCRHRRPRGYLGPGLSLVNLRGKG